MKETTRVGLVLILVWLMAVLSFPVMTGAHGGGTNFIREFDCTISLAELGGGDVDTVDTLSVETSGGNVMMKCRADLLGHLDPPARAVRTTGELCITALGPASDMVKVISPAGKVSLTCRINGRARPPAAGWAVGDAVDGYGTFLHTADDGETWVRQGRAGEIPGAGLTQVAAIDSQNAWVVGEPFDGYGLILRTRNGGRTWQRQGSPGMIPDAELFGVHAVDRKIAWVAGSPGVILHTTDGGRTWLRQGEGTVPPLAHLEGVYASDADHAWIVGSADPEAHGIILRTADGGAHWDEWTGAEIPKLENSSLIDIHGVGPGTVWTAGHQLVLYSPDGGITWVDRTPPGAPWFDQNGVFAVDRNIVWVVTDGGGIHRTADSGGHWEQQAAPPGATGDYIMRISAVDGQTAWAVSAFYCPGDPGHVLYTADGGQTWVAQTIPVAPAFWGVSFVR